MTYLTGVEIRDIIHFAGHHIRLFLGNSNPDDFRGDAKESIIAFHKTPGEFSDEALLEKGSNIEEAHRFPVRIELRGINVNRNSSYADGAAQVSAKGIWGPARHAAREAIAKELSRFDYALKVRIAGSSSFEFNRIGVDKSLPIHFLRANWEHVLDVMGYTPGPIIDSRDNRIIIATDGDGTIYDGPKKDLLPLFKDSPAFQPLVSFMKAGGIFMLISGNDLNRTVIRMVEGLPAEVYGRFLIAANGGADLARLGAKKKPVYIDGYREHALSIAHGHAHRPVLDIIYMGDDKSPNGNDYAAFEAVGPNRAICVGSLEDTRMFLEKWMHERKINSL